MTNILLVDDERGLLDQAKIFLERLDESMDVQTVSSAKEGLEELSRKKYDIVVSDYQMPEMDGLEFLEELRKERENDIPFIMFTGKGRENVAMKALNLGADRYIQKGGDPRAQYEVLAQAIKQEFEHKGAEEKIVELNSLLRSLSNVNRLISEEHDLKTLMEKAAVELVNTRDYQNMEISLLDRKDGKIKPVVSSGVHPKREWEVTNDGSGDAPKCVKEAVRNSSTHLVKDPEKYCTGCEYMGEIEYHNTLLVSITHRSELTGIISACHRSGRDLSEEEVELLEVMGRDLGLAREKIIVENKLKESEEKFKNLAEVTSLPIAIYQDEYWVYANPSVKNILGYSLEELKEMKHWDLVAPEHREMVKKQVSEKEGLGSGYEVKIITKDGKMKWVYLIVGKIDYKDEPAGLISFIDITDKKKKEGKLQKTKEELKKNKKRRKLEDFAIEMESVDDQEKLYRLTVEAAYRILDFEICSLDIVKDNEFEVKATIDGVREKGTRYPIEGLTGETYREGESFLDDIEHIDLDRGTYKSVMSVPVGDFGVFTVWSEQKDHFNENDLELAETLIHHTKLVLDRIKGEEKLRKSEEKYRTIFENFGDPVIIKKLGGEDDGSILDANRAMSDMLGYSSEELIEMNVYDDIAVRDPEELSWDEVKEKLKEGDKTEFSVKKRKKDGSEVWVEVVAVPMEYEGENAALAVNRDVTDRERRKSELQERVKELDCLYTISNLTQKQDMTVEGLLQEIVENIPPGFSYPEDASARITFDGQSYESESFEGSSRSLSKDFSTEYGSGEIEVYVDRKGDSEYLFLEQEKELLNSITVNLENFIERRKIQQELERIEWMQSKEQVASNAEKDSTSFQDQGYGDLTDLNDDGMILQSLGKDLLNDIVSEYLDFLETSSAIYEKNGDYAFGIFSSGWCKFMDRQSRKLCDTEDNADALNSGKWLCHESCWTDCSKIAIEKEEPVDIECNGGIRLYAVPIFAGGEVIGAIDFGYGTPPKDPEKLQELAEKYNVDYEELVEEANRYNPRPDFIIEMAKNRLHASARLIGTLVERKQAESALEENKKKIERLHEISAEIQTCDSEEEVYSLAMDAAEDILDFDICGFDAVEGDMFVRRAISTKTPEDGHTDSRIEEGDLASKSYLNQKSYLVDDLLEDKDAKPVKNDYRSAISVPIGKHGVFQAVSTEVGHFEEEDLKTAELLISHVSQALERIQIRNREDFLHSLLRHDLKNKNQIIQGYLELLEDHDLSDEVKEFVYRAERAAKDSIEMIRKVRNLRKIEEEEEIDEMDLGSVMDKVLSEHKDQLQEKDIDIDMAECDCKVKGGALLEELFSNLVGNSVKHSDCEEIKVSIRVEEDECMVTIEDDGSGIPDDIKEKIFEKGFKSGTNAGTGLGLYMVREIAESYGGSVEVEDSELGGAGFTVHLRKVKS